MAMYAYLDGDDVGLRIESGLLINSEDVLRRINAEVNSVVYELTGVLICSNHEIIFSGADGIICKSEHIDVERIHSFLRETKFSIGFSIGIGHSLRDAFAALRFAKANGKGSTAVCDDGFEWLKRK